MSRFAEPYSTPFQGRTPPARGSNPYTHPSVVTTLASTGQLQGGPATIGAQRGASAIRGGRENSMQPRLYQSDSRPRADERQQPGKSLTDVEGAHLLLNLQQHQTLLRRLSSNGEKLPMTTGPIVAGNTNSVECRSNSGSSLSGQPSSMNRRRLPATPLHGHGVLQDSSGSKLTVSGHQLFSESSRRDNDGSLYGSMTANSKRLESVLSEIDRRIAEANADMERIQMDQIVRRQTGMVLPPEQGKRYNSTEYQTAEQPLGTAAGNVPTNQSATQSYIQRSSVSDVVVGLHQSTKQVPVPQSNVREAQKSVRRQNKSHGTSQPRYKSTEHFCTRDEVGLHPDALRKAPSSQQYSRTRVRARSPQTVSKMQSKQDRMYRADHPTDVSTSAADSDVDQYDRDRTTECNGSSRVGHRKGKTLSEKQGTESRVASESCSSSEHEDDDEQPRRLNSSRRRPNRNDELPRRYSSHKEIKPGKYDGKGCVETYLAQFDVCANHNDWDKKEKLAQLKCALSDHAAQLIWDSGNPAHVTYDELVEKLRRRYGSLDQQEKFQAELRSRRRRNGESLAELCQDIRGMMTRAYPGEGLSPLCGQISKDYFLAALDDKDLELKVREREPRDLDSAFKHAVRLEALTKAVDGSSARDDSKAKNRRWRDDQMSRRVTESERKPTAVQHDGGSCQAIEQRNSVITNMQKKLEVMDKELGRLKAVQTARESVTTPVTNANLPVQTGPAQARAAPRQRGRVGLTCFNCRELGHIARECTLPRQTNHQADQTRLENASAPADVVVSAATKEEAKRKIYLALSINGTVQKCLVDSGSDVTILPAPLVSEMPLQKCNQRIRAANGTLIRVAGQIELLAEAGDHRLSISGLVSDHVAEVMLGNDFLVEHEALWNFKTGELVLNGVVYQLCNKDSQNWCRRVVLQSDCSVPPRTEVILPTKVVYNDLAKHELVIQQWITKAHTLPCGLQVSRVALPDTDVDVPVRILNPTMEDVPLKAGTVISNLEPVDICSASHDLETDTPETCDTVLNEMVDRVDTLVSSKHKEQLYQLLKEFGTTFSQNENDLGKTSLFTHRIETGENRPVRQALRRHPMAHQEAIRQQVKTMLEQKIIEPSKSPWASNVVLVRKKDNTLRCCIDYRQLNKVTVKDAYPLPRTDVCLDAMNGSSWFSTFDLRSSYHQVPMDSDHADKTAFICQEGQFRFLTMPFGLCNAGATFQRLMDIVMSGLTFEVCLSYLDDVIVFAPSVEEQLVRLRLVLERFRQAGLKLKPSKCCLLQTSVAFLGHVVSAGKISVDPKKVADVVDWPIPMNITEVRSFIGLCSYYRRFIKNFSSIAAPLTALTGKNQPYRWDESCQESFETLKQLLTTAPTLAMPDEQGSFVLDTDASAWAIGAVLSQLQNGVEKPIAYASRKLSKQEANYCTTRRELLAVVFFMKYFRHYLLGRHFQVRTDHAALQWLRRIPDPVGQQARWIGYMEEFDFDIAHRAGSRHGNADAMSRKPCRNKDCLCTTKVNMAAATHLSGNDLVNVTEVSSTEVISSDFKYTAVDVSANANSVPSAPDETEGDLNISMSAFYDIQDMSSEWSTEEELDDFDPRQVTSKDHRMTEVGVNPCPVVDSTSEMSVGISHRATDRCGNFHDAASSLMLEGICVIPNKLVDISDLSGVRSNEDHTDVDRDINSESVSAGTNVTSCSRSDDAIESPDASYDSSQGNNVIDSVLVVSAHEESLRAIRAVINGLRDATIDVAEDIAKNQEADDDIAPILRFMRNSGSKPSWDEVAPLSPGAKALWQQWDRLFIRQGVLCRRFMYFDRKPHSVQVVVPFNMREAIFRVVHEGVTGGHMGRKRTQDQLQRRAYWPGWTADLRVFLRRCSTCARYHRGSIPKTTPLKPMVVGDVWERVSIDVTGPHPRSRRGNCYLLTIVDHFSKWSDAFPIPNHTATTVARVLFDRVFSMFGPPLQLLTDRGSEFESALMQELCKWFGIQKLRTTAYKPSTNGAVERYHRSLNSILAKIIADDQRDWCEKVPTATAAYRASTHEVTGYSPNFIMFGRENRAPIDLLWDFKDDHNEAMLMDDFVCSKTNMMRLVYADVRNSLGVAANRRKDRYDTGVKTTTFSVGSWVWYICSRRHVGLSPKWQKHYTGPYLVVRVMSSHNLVLQKTNRSKPFVVHKDKVKIFLGEAPTPWVLRDDQEDEHTGDTVVSPESCTSNVERTRGRPKQNKLAKTKPVLSEVCPPEGSANLDSPVVVNDENLVRPVRNKRSPRYLTEFVRAVYRVADIDEVMPRKRCLTKCPVPGCQQVVTRQDSLTRHIRRHHAGFRHDPTQPSITVSSVESVVEVEAGATADLQPGSRDEIHRRKTPAPHPTSQVDHHPVRTPQRRTVQMSSLTPKRYIPTPGRLHADRQALIRAAEEVASSGPTVAPTTMMKRLTEPPHLLTSKIAEAIVIGSRISACNVANSSLMLVGSKVTNGTTWTRCVHRTLTQWADEPVFLLADVEEFDGPVSPKRFCRRQSPAVCASDSDLRISHDDISSQTRTPSSSRQIATPEQGVDDLMPSTVTLQERNDHVADGEAPTTISMDPQANSSKDERRCLLDLNFDAGESSDIDMPTEKQLEQTQHISSMTSEKETESLTTAVEPHSKSAAAVNELVQVVASVCSSPSCSDVESEREERYPPNKLSSNSPSRNDNKKPASRLNLKEEISRHRMVSRGSRTPVVHDYRHKEDWSIHLDPTAESLLVADSNMRRAHNLPSHWDAHVFPGAYLRDVPRLLFSMAKPRISALRRIFVQVGINDRDHLPAMSVVDDMIRAARVLHVDLAYVGVSTSLELPTCLRRNVCEMNQLLRSHCRFFVSPIPSEYVRVVAGDRQHIHHDEKTIDAIVAGICDFEKRMIRACEEARRRS